MKFEFTRWWSGEVIVTIEAGTQKAALEQAVRERANLGGANLRDADLGVADLRDADLGGANLRDANLGGADLRDADLRGADLGGADLRDADLGGADLRDADLRGADLRDADLRGANLGGACGIIDGGSPDGWRAVAWQKDGAVLVRVGCRMKTLPEARKHWSGKGDRREVIAFLDYVERVAEIRGWLTAESVSPMCDAANATA